MTLKQSNLDSRPAHVAVYMRMSTDMQQYSIENQWMAIQHYAEMHGMLIVKTYRDEGRSGLTVDNRPGLLSLLHAIGTGRPGFDGILVLDVSRWGRFQNTDEAAYYEFLCWKAGIRVFYVAELFDNDQSPFSMVFKGLKRAMAAEYSRELSEKASAGHLRLAKMGYRQGAMPGYGLRRMLVSADGKRKGILKDGELKNLATDRIILVPGPPEEIRIVRWMFKRYLAGDNCSMIARALNARGILSDRGKPWVYMTVRNILDNEKYCGRAVYYRSSKKLAGPTIHHPPSEWIRNQNAYDPVVSPALFEEVRARRIQSKTHLTNEELIERTRALLARKGRLTKDLLDAEPSLLSSRVLTDRFGSLTALYQKVGYTPRRHFRHAFLRRWLTMWRHSLTGFIYDWLADAGSTVTREGWRIRVDQGWSVSVTVVHGATTTDGRLQWLNHRANTDADFVIFARMVYGEPTPIDYFVAPSVLFDELPKAFHFRNGPVLECCQFSSLAILGDLARLSRLDARQVETTDARPSETLAQDDLDKCGLLAAAEQAEARFRAVERSMDVFLGDKEAAAMLARYGLLHLTRARTERRSKNGHGEAVVVMEGVVLVRLLSTILSEPQLVRWFSVRYPKELSALHYACVMQ